MNLIDEFHDAAARSKALTRRPTNEELLDLYSLFKQATDGDNRQSRPGGFDFKAIAKHDAWVLKAGKSKDEAMRDYIDLVNNLYQQ